MRVQNRCGGSFGKRKKPMVERTYYVYILRCADNSLYIGVTNDIDRRFAEHQNGFHPDCYTFTRRPVKLEYVDVTDDVGGAIFREKQLKRWSRKKKEALIREDETELKHLARHRIKRHYDWRYVRQWKKKKT